MAVDKDKQKEIIESFSKPKKGLWDWLTGKNKKKKYSKAEMEKKMKKQYRA